MPSGQQVYNSFSISILAQNLCPPQKYVSQGPYEISDKPVALIKDIIDTISCQGAYYTFIDSSKLGYKVLGSQCDSTNPRNWIISPDSGYVITNGSIGQNRPDWWDPFTWGSDSITLQFTDPGNFEVSLLVENVCGGDSIIDTVFQKICIDSIAHSEFFVDKTKGCFPLNVQAINTSKSLMALGVILYLVVGFLGILLGGNFLEYNYLSNTPINGQLLGIFLVELGVGLTVSNVMVLVFYSFNDISVEKQ